MRTNASIACSSSSPAIWPWPTTIRASGTIAWTRVGDRRGCRGRGCGRSRPARRGSARGGWRGGSVSASKRMIRVSIALRSGGGVSRFEMSRMPSSAQVQGPRDRRGRQGQHVHRRPQRLEPLLVLDAEPLLLVDDDQAQVLERARPSDTSRCVPIMMSTPPGRGPLEDVACCSRPGPEAADDLDDERDTRPSAG